MDRPSGIEESELVRVRLSGIGKKDNAQSITRQDIAALRAIPGVKSVACMNMVPFGGSSWNSDVSTIKDDPNGINAAFYMGTPTLIDTLGVHIIAGRQFTREEYIDYDVAQAPNVHIPSIILTKALADRLFPGGDAVGKPVYVTGKEPQIVVGVVDQIARPNDGNGASLFAYSMFLPIDTSYTVGGNYMLRVDPDRKGEVLTAVTGVLEKVDPARIILDHDTFDDIRKDHFKQDRAMAWLLGGVCIALLIITALGVVGLASFWVQQRTRQIGIRRALGATRADIRHYFQLENFILATVGIVVGMAMAYGINMWLMEKYEVSRLPAQFLPIGAFLLWVLGQIAVLGPAMRASAIPPAIATRSV
jgi:putative ABC transport system permease protein